jgi:fatty acid desaturase
MLPYFIFLIHFCKPHFAKTRKIIADLDSDTARPEPAVVKLSAWACHLLVGADGPALAMWLLQPSWKAALYPCLGSLFYELFWTPCYGLTQHSLFNDIRSEEDHSRQDSAKKGWDEQQLLTSTDCVPTGPLCWTYSVLCMHADVYQSTHHLLPAVHWSLMPQMQELVRSWAMKHGLPYAEVNDKKALYDFYCGKWDRRKSLIAEKRPRS